MISRYHTCNNFTIGNNAKREKPLLCAKYCDIFVRSVNMMKADCLDGREMYHKNSSDVIKMALRQKKEQTAKCGLLFENYG